MAEVTKLLYIVVVDDGEKTEEGKDSFRYTRPVLQCTLQLMGCKPRHSFKISKRVFEVIRGSSADSSPSVGVGMTGSLAAGPAMKVNDNTTGRGSLAAGPAMKVNDNTTGSCSGVADTSKNLVSGDNSRNENIPFESYKRRTTVTVGRENFLDVVCDALAEYKYMGPNQREDLVLACRIRERKESVTVLLCGTSGCGKSTLSSLLGSRLGITTVLSTDSIRHMMRSFADEKQNPLLWASTYHAGECLDPVAVAEAKARRKANKLAGVSCSLARDEAVHGYTVRSDGQSSRVASVAEPLSPRRMAVEGFKAQSEMVIDSLDRLITAWEERKESVVVEGVHLSLNFVMGLMKKHPSIIPFMIYISNEEKHLERFAVRAKYMTLDPAKNKYVKYIRNIRTIQEYLCKRADKHLVPKINNTNVDRSVAAIHATVFGCLRRRDAGEQLYDPATNTVSVIDEEYRHRCAANSMSSKGMLQLIQRKGSTRHLMALLNTDGSVAKAWPVDSGTINDDCGGDDGVIGHPVYGPLLMGKAERVNLQFGHFGISAWPGDTGGTSYASSADGSRTEGTESSSRHHSPCSSSSPRMSDGHDKELKEEQSVSGSDEEVDDLAEVDSDEDVSYGSERQMDEEVEGSVDESTKSDEEYDDLAMEDVQEDGYSFDEECSRDERVPCFEDRQIHGEDGDDVMRDKYKENLAHFLQTVGGAMPEPPPCSYSSLVVVGSECELAESGDDRTDKRSLSIPLVLGKRGPLISILSGAPLR